MRIRVVDYVGNTGGGIRFTIELLKALVDRHPEASYEFVSHGPALKRYRPLIRHNCGSVDLLDIRPRRFWCNRYTSALNRSGLLSLTRGSVGTRWYYEVPAPVLEECDVAWLPWMRHHRIGRSLFDKVIATFHDVISSEMGIHRIANLNSRYLAEDLETQRQWVTSSARIVVDSDDMGREMGEYFGVPATRFDSVPLSGEHARGRRIGELPASWQWAGGRFILYPANLSRHKNHEVLLEAFSRWGQKCPLILTGAGTERLLPRMRILGRLGESFVSRPSSRVIQLRQIAEQLGLRLGESVIPLGYLSDVTYYSLLSRAWAMVMPSLAEGFGFPVYEALVSGVPVVCSDIPVLREQVARTEGAVMWFDPRDPSDLATKLRLLEEQYDQHRTRALGQMKTLRRRTWSEVADKYWEVMSAVRSSRTRGLADVDAVMNH